MGQQAAPIHSVIRAQRPDKSEILLSLLVHTSVDVNLPDLEGMTPLHLVVQVKCYLFTAKRLQLAST